MYVGIKKTSRLGDILFFCTRTSNCKFEKKKRKKEPINCALYSRPNPDKKKIKKTNVLFEYMCVSLEVLMCVDLCYTCRYTMRFLIIQRESISTDNDFLSRGISGFECLGMFDVLN